MNVILFGATGMVGQAVLRECLSADRVESIFVVGRSSTGLTHPKLREGIRKDLLLAMFPSAYMFRLAMLIPRNREVSKTRWTRISYLIFRPLLPLLRVVLPGAVITTEELGRAMIRAAQQGAPKRVLESRDLRALGAK